MPRFYFRPSSTEEVTLCRSHRSSSLEEINRVPLNFPLVEWETSSTDSPSGSLDQRLVLNGLNT